MTTNDIQNITQKHKDLATQTYKTLHRNKKIQQHKPTKHYIETKRFSNTNLQNTTQKQKDLVTQTYKALHRNKKIQ